MSDLGTDGATDSQVRGERRRYRSALRSERAIETAFARLLREKPAAQIAVTDVVAQAGVARATFYAHFHSTEDLLARIQGKVTEELSSFVDCIVSADDFEGVLAAVGELSRVLAEDADFYRNLLVSSGAGAFLAELRGQTYRRLLGLLAPMEDERRRTKVEVDLTMVLAGAQAVLEARVLGRGPADVAAVDVRIAQHIMAFRATYVGQVIGWERPA